MNPQKRREIFERLRAANPDPATELEYRTPFELLVAVILSAQATDRSVNLATQKLYLEADTPAKILALGMAARCRSRARRSKRCPGSAGKPPT
jgi:endonuclease-3